MTEDEVKILCPICKGSGINPDTDYTDDGDIICWNCFGEGFIDQKSIKKSILDWDRYEEKPETG
jgi:hypothetical protein